MRREQCPIANYFSKPSWQIRAISSSARSWLTGFDDSGTALDSSKAEFIRLQCAAARYLDKSTEWERLQLQAANLFHTFGWQWYGRVSRPAAWAAGWLELFSQFESGFITTLRIPTRLVHLVADLPGLLGSEPVGTIAFEGMGVRTDHLRALRRLRVSPRPVRLTFRCPSHLGNPVSYLTTALDSPLALAAITVDAATYGAGCSVARILHRSPFIANLEELILDENRLAETAVSALTNNPKLRKLRLLSLKRNYLGTQSIDCLRQRFGDRVAF